MSNRIVIRGQGSISPLGANPAAIRRAYAEGDVAHSPLSDIDSTPVASLSAAAEEALFQFVESQRGLHRLDRSVQLAAYASSKALSQAGWSTAVPVGIFIGSSRGATASWEGAYERYRLEGSAAVPTRTSPITTAGNLSSSVAQLFQLQGVHVSHSITCSTALHAVLHGIAWLRSGLVSRVLVGGAEAPLTGFTVAQMKALGIYTQGLVTNWPCRPFFREQTANSFMLGEGAAVFCLESVAAEQLVAGDLCFTGVGFSTELTASGTGISPDGAVFQETMTAAAHQATGLVDCILAHAPGTARGDAAELAAIQKVFETVPAIYSGKFLTGHTFGASGALTLELATLLLGGDTVMSIPYETVLPGPSLPGGVPQAVLVNATGFGGNAVSLVVERV